MTAPGVAGLFARWRRHRRARVTTVRLRLYGGPFDGATYRVKLERGRGQLAVCVVRPTLVAPDGTRVQQVAVYQATETGWTQYDPQLTAAHLRSRDAER